LKQTTSKAGALVFIAIMLIITYPTMANELGALAGVGVIFTAIRIVVPIAWLLAVLGFAAMGVYVLTKG